jgi:hypothetical protein
MIWAFDMKIVTGGWEAYLCWASSEMVRSWKLPSIDDYPAIILVYIMGFLLGLRVWNPSNSKPKRDEDSMQTWISHLPTQQVFCQSMSWSSNCSIMNALGDRYNDKKEEQEEQDDANAHPLPSVSLVLLCSLQLTCPSCHIISSIIYLPSTKPIISL